MTNAVGQRPRPATFDDLAAFNRELAALVRAGLPLEEGLDSIAEDMGRGPGEIAARLQRETTAGRSLGEAIAAQGDALPPVYRAIVEAGLASGRLPAALEGYAESAARMADLRRIAAQTAAYPLIVIALSVVMFLWVALMVLPSFALLDAGPRVWAMGLVPSRQTALVGMVAAPVLIAFPAWVWWRRSARPRSMSGIGGWAARLPGGKRAARLSSHANFAELLGLLTEVRVPLLEALPLAAGASGDAELRAAATALSASLAVGQPLLESRGSFRQLPPLVRTAMLGRHDHQSLSSALFQAGAAYRERADAWTAHVALVAPIAATIAVGAVVICGYALLLFQPYVATLEETASWY
jgi:type II secretory pathway component PulF